MGKLFVRSFTFNGTAYTSSSGKPFSLDFTESSDEVTDSNCDSIFVNEVHSINIKSQVVARFREISPDIHPPDSGTISFIRSVSVADSGPETTTLSKTYKCINRRLVQSKGGWGEVEITFIGLHEDS